MTRRTMGPNLAFFRATRIFARCRNPVEDACPICLEHYSKDHRAVRVRLRGCMHTYGRECIDGWLLSGSPNRNTCPTCRMEWYTLDPEEEVQPPLEPSGLLASLRRGRDRIRRSLAAKIEPKANPADIITGIRVPASRVLEFERGPVSRGLVSDEHHFAELSGLLTILETRFAGTTVPRDAEERLRHLELRIQLLRRDSPGRTAQSSQPSLANGNNRTRRTTSGRHDGRGFGTILRTAEACA